MVSGRRSQGVEKQRGCDQGSISYSAKHSRNVQQREASHESDPEDEVAKCCSREEVVQNFPLDQFRQLVSSISASYRTHSRCL